MLSEYKKGESLRIVMGWKGFTEKEVLERVPFRLKLGAGKSF
jgi:hypothetical protein